ncbi:PRC-barrel domain-containing protein [Pseudothauera nasutitermitis]|nr:PRC-barrel domain-containing protein [Pseudothauera nasutitermitis]
MNTKLRNTLMGGAIALLAASPVWAAEESPGTYGEPIPRSDTVVPQESAPAQGGMVGPAPAVSANPLYARTPADLRGLDVVDAAGNRVGKLKTLLLGPDGQSAHVVISSGGFLGLGASENIVPLDQLQLLEGRLQANFLGEDLVAGDDYDPGQYVELRPDRPISEFSAFEPVLRD